MNVEQIQGRHTRHLCCVSCLASFQAPQASSQAPGTCVVWCYRNQSCTTPRIISVEENPQASSQAPGTCVVWCYGNQCKAPNQAPVLCAMPGVIPTNPRRQTTHLSYVPCLVSSQTPQASSQATQLIPPMSATLGNSSGWLLMAHRHRLSKKVGKDLATCKSCECFWSMVSSIMSTSHCPRCLWCCGPLNIAGKRTIACFTCGRCV